MVFAHNPHMRDVYEAVIAIHSGKVTASQLCLERDAGKRVFEVETYFSAIGLSVLLVECISYYKVYHFSQFVLFFEAEINVRNSCFGSSGNGYSRFGTALPVAFVRRVSEEGNLVAVAVGPVFYGAICPCAGFRIILHRLIVHISCSDCVFYIIERLLSRKISHNAEATVFLCIRGRVFHTFRGHVHATGCQSGVYTESYCRMGVRVYICYFILRAAC